MSAYAITTENRLRECLKAVQDVITSNFTDKDCRTPIFGFAATSLLTLTFVILQDNVERKARNMGVWEVCWNLCGICVLTLCSRRQLILISLLHIPIFYNH